MSMKAIMRRLTRRIKTPCGVSGSFLFGSNWEGFFINWRKKFLNNGETNIRRNANGWRRRRPLYSSQIVQPFLNVYTAFYYNNTNKDGSRKPTNQVSAKIYIILQWSVIIFTTHLCLSFLCIFLYIIEFVLILWFVTDYCHCSFLPSLRCIVQ